MTAAPETTNLNYNEDLRSEGAEPPSSDARTPVTRAREESTTPWSWLKSRRRGPVLTEATTPEQPGRKRGARTPWREDRPSPWCVLQDYREGAARFGGEAAGAKALYWALAWLPLLLNMLLAAGHEGTLRPARFYGAAIALVLFVICWRLAI